ncbi:MAG: hypothetical protein MI922_18280 [Bacteroidales bacterium]|nr:hypothetical protein [Bacteroidales bacterium]
MSKLKDKADLNRTRATWLAGKTGINYAKAHAILQNIAKPTPKEEKKISDVLRKEARAPLYLKHTK